MYDLIFFIKGIHFCVFQHFFIFHSDIRNKFSFSFKWSEYLLSQICANSLWDFILCYFFHCCWIFNYISLCNTREFNCHLVYFVIWLQITKNVYFINKIKPIKIKYFTVTKFPGKKVDRQFYNRGKKLTIIILKLFWPN